MKLYPSKKQDRHSQPLKSADRSFYRGRTFLFYSGLLLEPTVDVYFEEGTVHITTHFLKQTWYGPGMLAVDLWCGRRA